MIERSVRTVKEGTSATLIQSGLDDAWWPQAMACYCFLKTVVDILNDDKTAFERRFGASLSSFFNSTLMTQTVNAPPH